MSAALIRLACVAVELAVRVSSGAVVVAPGEVSETTSEAADLVDRSSILPTVRCAR